MDSLNIKHQLKKLQNVKLGNDSKQEILSELMKFCETNPSPPKVSGPKGGGSGNSSNSSTKQKTSKNKKSFIQKIANTIKNNQTPINISEIIGALGVGVVVLITILIILPSFKKTDKDAYDISQTANKSSQERSYQLSNAMILPGGEDVLGEHDENDLVDENIPDDSPPPTPTPTPLTNNEDSNDDDGDDEEDDDSDDGDNEEEPTTTPTNTSTPSPTPTITPTPSPLLSPTPTVEPTTTPTSTPTPTLTVTPTPGDSEWSGEYYDDMHFTSHVFDRNDQEINFSWPTGESPHPDIEEDTFSIIWRREVYFDSGTYIFHVLHDDGVKVYVDGHIIIHEWEDQPVGGGSHQATKTLTEGLHDIKVKYYENERNAMIHFWWEQSSSG